jgi:hypothetical protein
MQFGNEFWLILFRENIIPKLFAVYFVAATLSGPITIIMRSLQVVGLYVWARGYLTWIINAHFMLFLLNDVRCMGGSGMQVSISAQINDHCFTRGGLLKLKL